MKQEVYKIDAQGMAPGRLASEISLILQGKNKSDWMPGKDFYHTVEVTSAGKIRLTGKKRENYKYYTHSGYPGGLKVKLMADVSPEFMIKNAVFKMLPKNRLRKQRIKRLKFI